MGASRFRTAGVPSTVVFDADKLVDRNGQPLLPTVAAETIIYDHGKVLRCRQRSTGTWISSHHSVNAFQRRNLTQSA